MSTHHLTLTQVSGSADFAINTVIDSAQMLVKVCRNGEAWLSPTGWSHEVKNTLLDCRVSDTMTRIVMPDDFGGAIQAGDTVSLSIAAIGFEDSVQWESQPQDTAAPETPLKQSATDIPPQPTAALRADVKPVKPSLISRLTVKKPAAEPQSDIERRAEDAKKAAEASAEEMRKAHEAKEAAQQRAIEAARLAEAAHKMELERIEQAKKAQDALRDAEAAKRAEQERLEAQRLAEAARIAEEARQAEQSRLETEAARLEAARIAHIEALRTEHKSLRSKLSGHQGELVSLGKALKSAKTDLNRMETEAVKASEDSAKAERRVQDAEAALQHEIKERDAAIAKAKTVLSDRKGAVQNIQADLKTLKTDIEKRQRECGQYEDGKHHAQNKLAAEQARQADIDAHIKAVQATPISAQTIMRLEQDGVDIQDRPNTILTMLTGKKPSQAQTQSGAQPNATKAKPFWKRTVAKSKITPIQPFSKPAPSTKPASAVKLAADNTSLFADHENDDDSFPVKKVAYGAVAFIAAAGVITLASHADKTASEPKIAKTELIRVEPSSVLTASETITPSPTPISTKAKIKPSIPLEQGAKVEPIQTELLAAVTNGPRFSEHLQSKAANTPISAPIVAKPIAVKQPIVKHVNTPKPRTINKTISKIKPQPIVKVETRPARVEGVVGIEARHDIPPKPYAALTMDVQKKLSTLGFYRGPVSGVLDQSTISAMNDFQTLFGMSESKTVTPELLTELGRAGLSEPAPIIKTEPAPKVIIDAPPALAKPEPQPVAALVEPKLEVEPVIDLVEPEPKPEVADLIVNAKKIRGRAPTFPDKAVKRIDQSIIVYVAYTINEYGNVENAVVDSVEGENRYQKLFERAALKSINSTVFSPKTVNGQPVASPDRTTRIVFSVE